MLHAGVQKRKNRHTARAVEHAAKRQCKKDKRKTEALLAKAHNQSEHVFNPKCVELVMRKAHLVKECLSKARAIAKS